MDRTAGVLIPLFSLRSHQGFGVGELPDIGAIAPWLAEARLRVLMMLPLNEAALGQDSPYAALSASAIDPIFIRLSHVPEFPGEAALSDDEKRELAAVRASPTVEYGRVRALKERWLRRCWDKFRGRTSPDLERFRKQHERWLPEYTLFRALKENHRRDWWRGFPPELRDRDPQALEEAKARYADDIAFYEYVQWRAYEQLAATRAEARKHGIRLAGDLPFMVAEDSADVWARQDEFRFDATVGVPPDAFSADGQDWGLPPYRWDVIKARGYDWLVQRGHSAADLYDLVRVDHVVGFYRTYNRPKDRSPHFFVPADEASQIAQGEAVMRALAAGGAELVAEDLGVVPPFVRQSLTRMGIPGYRVLRWEKDEQLFREPARWPELSLACTGTHDTEPLAVWWDSLPVDERREARKIGMLGKLTDEKAARFTPEAHLALLEAVYNAPSRIVLNPVTDLFGHRERINVPGTVGASNWSYRMPIAIEDLSANEEANAVCDLAAGLARRHGR